MSLVLLDENNISLNNENQTKQNKIKKMKTVWSNEHRTSDIRNHLTQCTSRETSFYQVQVESQVIYFLLSQSQTQNSE